MSNDPSAANHLKVVVISSNTWRPSKSRTLAETITRHVDMRLSVDFQLYDIVDAGPGLGAAFTRQALTPEALRVVEAIETADALIVATAVYKGSYTGLFKHLFDFVDQTALTDIPVVLAATGGGQRHALVVEHQLRPLFGFFTALTIPTAVYATDADFVDGALVEPNVLERVKAAAAQLSAILAGRAPRTLAAVA